MITQNVGQVDRAIRLLVGACLVGLSIAGAIGPWGWIGVVPIATGLFRWCPAYSLFGLKTCR